MKIVNAVSLLLGNVSAQTLRQTTLNDYQSNMDQNALSIQQQCKSSDSANPQIQSGASAPSCFRGFNLSQDFSMSVNPPYNMNIQSINSVDCAVGPQKVGGWCASDGNGRRQCHAMGTEQGPTSLTFQCMDMNKCEEFAFDGSSWTHHACLNLQCPAFTYRSGADNQERYNGQLVFRRQGCNNDADKARNRNLCDQMQPVQSAIELGGYSRSMAPFQCIHDDCLSSQGQYIQKGNTDSGPTDHLGGASRALIEPFWTAGINTYNQFASASQGRCGQCQPYEASTQTQEILSYKWSQYDQNGQVRFGETPKSVGQGSLGCYTCPPFESRDQNGNCRRPQCSFNQVLQRDGVQQGQCIGCPVGQVPDSLGQNCVSSGPIGPVCDTRSFQNQITGQCERCSDYLCPQQGLNRCVLPVCPIPNSRIDMGCGCIPCPAGTQVDSLQRNCLGSVPQPVICGEWTRLNPLTGQCESENCSFGQQLIQNGVGQGTCTACPIGTSSSFNYRGCISAVTCGPSEQLDVTGTYCVPAGCPQYTRRQQDGQCAPDRCGPNEYNIQYTSFNFGQTEQQGRCLPCGPGSVGSQPDPQNYNAQTACVNVTPTCQPNEFLDSSGRCISCGPCETPDVISNTCVPITCGNRDILRQFPNALTGIGQTCQCEACPSSEIPNADRSACVRCPTDSYINQLTGQCQRCQAGASQSADGFSCLEKQCGTRQYVDFDGKCQDCGDYQISDGRQCYEQNCGDRSIVLKNGQLENCPAFSKMVVNDKGDRCRQCGEATCTNRQYLSSEGYCYECQDYTVPDGTRRECITPSCPGNSIITVSGTCQACPDGSNPDSSQRQCIEVFCGARQRIVKTGSKTDCVDCPAKTRAQDENKVCRADPCDPAKREFTREDGICQPCPPYQIVNKEKTQCVYPKCGDNEVVKEDGKCEACPKYHRRVDFGAQSGFSAPTFQCQECVCDSQFRRQYCMPNGTCETCPEFQIPTTNGKACQKPTCPQVVNKDGSCGVCEDWHYWDKEQEKCLPRVCDSRSRVTRNGQCEKCPLYFYVTENKRDCLQCNCKAREICQEDGTCKKCDDYFIVGTSGEDAGKCVKATCDNGVLQKDGSCKFCGSCEILNKDKTKCIKPECDKREVLQYDGKCFECEKFTGPRLYNGDKCGAICQSCQPTGRQYIREDGECEVCPDYSRISSDRRQCSAVPCKENAIITKDGFCQPCPDYTLNDKERRECVPTKCLENEILKKDGTCEACPKYQRADPTGRTCMQSACNDSEYFDEKGYCKKCRPCSRSSLENLRTKCFSDTCQANQILQSDGRCQNCPAYTKPTSTEDSKGKCGQLCKVVECAENEIVLEDGTCQACPSWTMPQQSARVCGPSICGAQERLLINGRCEECTEYSRGAGKQEKQQFTECKPDKCKANQILTKEGTCKFCGPYERAESNGKKCSIPPCGDRTKRLLPDATFEACADYSRATKNCRQCAPDPCTLREKLLKTGLCEKCDDYMRATPDGKDCRMPVCEKNQILLVDGTCQDCPPFMRRATGGRQCVKVTCAQTERLLPSGECEPCEAYSRAINDGKACAPNLCTQRQKILPDGTCQDCPQYTRATSDHKGCASQVCTARQILQVDGRCAECYPYTRADAAGKICVPHNCNDRQKLGPDGSCVDCPNYERAQGTGLTCGPDSCNIRQRIQRDGTCIYCELFHAVSSNRRACLKPTCKPMVEHISMDGICQPCKFYEQTAPNGTECKIDPTKKLPDPQIMAPTPVSLQSAPKPAQGTSAGYDVWTDEQFLSEDRATGFYLNQKTGNWGFILGNAVRLSSVIAGLGTGLLIALNAL